jgi:GNAT superfamily N-acetyltransferase
VTIVQNPAEPSRSQAIALLLIDRGPEAQQAIQALTSQSSDANAVEVIAAQRGGVVVGATLLRRQPGLTAQVWSPRIAAREPSEVAMGLLDAAMESARRWQCSLVQAVLEPASDVQFDAIAATGFERVAELLFLVSWLHEAPQAPTPRPFEFAAYRESDRRRLAELIEATYEGTLDCPRLNGVRRSDDVVASHQATGLFDPGNWFFVRQGGDDIGCLLLAKHPHSGQWELVYMGLLPTARGRGYGLQLVQAAQSLARQKGASQLVLAVDAANAPAIATYLAAGFVVWDRKPVYLKILPMRW